MSKRVREIDFRKAWRWLMLELDINNPRPFLIQGLFDSDSDTDEDDKAEEIQPALDKAQQRRLGGVRSDDVVTINDKGRAIDTEAELEEYEMASRVKADSSHPSNENSDLNEGKPSALQSDRSFQDSLSGELLRMAGVLKANSMAFADALERDRKLLEEAGEKLHGNLTLMTRTRGKLGEYSRKARGMGWFTLGSVAVVCFSWLLMFLLIKLT